MIKAETAYNIVQALPEKEVKRFYRMLGMVPAEPKKPKRKPLITKEESLEYVKKKIEDIKMSRDLVTAR